MPRKSILALLFLSLTAFAAATEIQTEEETLRGTILGKEGGEIFFETQNGIFNIRKADILSIDGKPYVYAPPKPVVAPAPVADNMPAHPQGVTEKEMRDYYESHREEFREPLKAHVRSLGQTFFTRSESEIRSDPTSEGNWKDGGWIEEGQTVEPFEEAVLRQIFNLGVGGVSQLLKDKDGVGHLLWIIERKESTIPPYEEVRPKVLNKILQSHT